MISIWQEEKRSLKEKLQAVQEVTLTVQNSIGTLASLLESIKKYLIPTASSSALHFYFFLFEWQHVQLQRAIPVVPGRRAAGSRLAPALRHPAPLPHPRLGRQQIHPQAPPAAQHPKQRTARFPLPGS